MTSYPQLDTPVPGIGKSGGGAWIEHTAERPLNQYCLFRAGRERYCLAVSEIEEVVKWQVMTRVPLAPRFLMGIFNLRGLIIPVLDIAFQEDRRADEQPNHLVVAAVGGEAEGGVLRLGLAVDELLGTHLTSEPLLVEETPRGALQCRGLLRYGKKLALALDLRGLAEAFPVPSI